MILSDLITYYQDRLIAQYVTKANARAQVGATVSAALADAMAYTVRDAYVLGTQFKQPLDIIGKYIGLPRSVAPASTPPGFEMGSYDDVPDSREYGFLGYDGSGDPAGIFLGYEDAGAQTIDLSQGSYQQMLLLKIYTNRMDGTTSGIVQYLADNFEGQIRMVDNQDMTITYLVDNNYSLPPMSAADTETVLLQYLPRPMGVGINIVRADLGSYFRITADGSWRVWGNIATLLNEATTADQFATWLLTWSGQSGVFKADYPTYVNSRGDYWQYIEVVSSSPVPSYTPPAGYTADYVGTIPL